MDAKVLEKKLKEISESIENGKELIQEESILEFQASTKDILKKINKVLEEGRQLRLGIVGEVKAGKSSFLNAMLFEGKDILPKAPTPMTAALTRISYNETPKAKIVFYDFNDWNSICTMARKYNETLQKMYEEYQIKIEQEQQKKFSIENLKYIKNVRKQEDKMKTVNFIMSKKDFERENRENIPMEYRACKEVLDLADSNNINVEAFLGTEKIIQGSLEEEYGYLKQLNEYVGSEGKYTAIVKYTEIQLNHKMLEGIEVIDTPGLNDPILSRSRTTQKFLIECDAVFLLGYCGQFLGADDMEFMMSSLPNEGINKAVLIGSKMDSAILQYPSKNNPSFKVAYLGTKRNCERQAEENINECSITSSNEKLLSQIKASLPPKCISSLAYAASLQMKKGEPLGKYEANMVKNFCRRFPDFPNDADTWLGLSNIVEVKKEVFEETKQQKEKIITERMKHIVSSQIVKFLNLLENISIQAKSNQSDLKKYDCEQLEAKLENLKENLDSVRIVVKNLFEKSAIESQRIIEDMAVDIGLEMSNHLQFEVVTSTKTQHHSSTSGHLWWKTTNEWDEVIRTNTAQLSDIDENIRNYCFSCMKMINANFKNLLKIDSLQNNIKATVIGAFEQSDKEFDENKILIPLENALSRITLPSLEMNLETYENMLDEKLGGIVLNGTVKNEKIPLLKRTQDKILAIMSQDIIKKIKEQGIMIDKNLQTQAALFIDNIVNQLAENQKKLEFMIQDKQASLKKLEEFIDKISQAKQILLELEA